MRHIHLRPKIFFSLLLLAALLLASGYYLFGDLPAIDQIAGHLSQPSIRITDRNNRPLYEILPDGEQAGRHAVLSFDQIPVCMKQATIAIEDRYFYQNPGVDMEGIVRALWIDLQGGETIAGGSTITQQVARNLLLSQDERSERSLRRKLREALLAWQLTNRLPKDQILALYLNETYYGGLAYGVEAASQTYFGKPAANLLLPECALLAGLPQAPGVYDPFSQPDLARQRELIVLGLMEKSGFISSAQRELAEATPLVYNPAPYPIEAPHFVWLVKSQLDGLFSAGQLDPRQSLVVRTTLDLDDQKLAEAAIARQIKAFQSPVGGGLSHNVNNAALVALDPHNGEILALVGSADYFDNAIQGAVDMATANRQPGSAFKPFIYAQALDPQRAAPWTAATTLLDVSTTFITHDGKPYTPKDYDGREHGPVSVRQALASSLNIPAVLTLKEVGVEKTVDLARRLGITSLDAPDQYDLTLALGGGQMSLLALSSAYAAFADGGLYRGNYAILDVHDADGKLVYTQEKAAPVQIFDPRVAWLISDILSDDRARATGFGRNSTLKIDRTAAVKTGTTTNFHDNWTIGYTPELLTGVWVGNSNYEAMHEVNGLTGAAPIWHQFMRAVLQGHPDMPFTQPDSFVQATVCDLSGLLPTSACQHSHPEWFIAGTLPTQTDTVYRQVWVDSQSGAPADESIPQARRQLVTVLDLPVRALPWARSLGLPLLADLGKATDTSSQPTAGSLALISPRPGTTYHMTSDIRQDAQQLAVEAVAGQGLRQVKIYADGALLATFSEPPYQVWWQLAVGQHTFRVEALDQNGQTVIGPEVTISVTAEN
jgi:penicillin-binding protein 1C